MRLSDFLFETLPKLHQIKDRTTLQKTIDGKSRGQLERFLRIYSKELDIVEQSLDDLLYARDFLHCNEFCLNQMLKDRRLWFEDISPTWTERKKRLTLSQSNNMYLSKGTFLALEWFLQVICCGSWTFTFWKNYDLVFYSNDEEFSLTIDVNDPILLSKMGTYEDEVRYLYWGADTKSYTDLIIAIESNGDPDYDLKTSIMTKYMYRWLPITILSYDYLKVN